MTESITDESDLIETVLTVLKSSSPTVFLGGCRALLDSGNWLYHQDLDTLKMFYKLLRERVETSKEEDKIHVIMTLDRLSKIGGPELAA